jgi:hypothetical protein
MMVSFETPDQDPDFAIREFVARRSATQIVTLKGRLNGGEASPHSLKFFEKLGPYPDAGGGFPRPMAYLGRSQENHPIILTNRGPLEILNKEFDLDFSSPKIIIVDEKEKREVARYFSTGVVDIKERPISVWTSDHGICVSALSNKPGLLKVHSNTCDLGSSALAAAPEVTLQQLVSLIPALTDLRTMDTPQGPAFVGDGYFVDVERIPATSFLVISFTCADECED